MAQCYPGDTIEVYGRGFGDPVYNLTYSRFGPGTRLYFATPIDGSWSPNITIRSNTHLSAVLPVPPAVGVPLDVSFGTPTTYTALKQSLVYTYLPTIVSGTAQHSE